MYMHLLSTFQSVNAAWNITFFPSLSLISSSLSLLSSPSLPSLHPSFLLPLAPLHLSILQRCLSLFLSLCSLSLFFSQSHTHCLSLSLPPLPLNLSLSL